jgi:CRISPR-associated protein Cas1
MLTEPSFMFSKTIFIFPLENEKIIFQNDNFVVLDKDEKIKFQYSCYKIFCVFIVGGFTITSKLIENSKKFGFSIVLMSTGFKILSTINYITEGNTLLREKQYKCEISNEIARKIIINKIQNQRDTLTLLRTDTAEAKEIIDRHLKELSKPNLDIDKIMGYEGLSAKVYFNRIFGEFECWHGRLPRVKRDIINALLDIGYTILFNYTEALLNLYGFDIYKGNLHQLFFRRKSLVCDMVEPYRPIIDITVRKMLNLNQIKEDDFYMEHTKYANVGGTPGKTNAGRFLLKWRNSAKISTIFIETLADYRQSMFRYIQQYYRWFAKGGAIKNLPKGELKKNDTN